MSVQLQCLLKSQRHFSGHMSKKQMLASLSHCAPLCLNQPPYPVWLLAMLLLVSVKTAVTRKKFPGSVTSVKQMNVAK